MSARDSAYRVLAAEWPALYGEMFRILGATGTIFAFGDQKFAGKVNATTFTTVRDSASGVEAVVTPSEALSAWDTPLNPLDPDTCYQGCIPILTFNGTDEEMDSPDAAYWTAGASAFSIGGWFEFTTVPNLSLFSKFDQTTGAELREWLLYTTSSSYIAGQVYDETTDTNIARSYGTALVAGRLYHIVMTYDGGTAATTIKIYLDGVQVDDASESAGPITDMRDTAALVRVGFHQGAAAPAQYFAGKMAGGPLGPFFVQTELTAAQVKNLYRAGVHAMGLG